MASSEPPTPTFPAIANSSQSKHRSTASSIRLKNTNMLERSWVGPRTAQLPKPQEYDPSRDDILKQSGRGEKFFSREQKKTPFVSVANNLMFRNSSEQEPLASTSQAVKKHNSMSWIFKDNETSKFYK